MNVNQSNTVLLQTSGQSSVQYSKGVLSVAGASARLQEITSFRQLKYKAQVLQVITVAGQISSGTYYTPTASTTYIVNIIDNQRRFAAVTQGKATFKYTTPSSILALGATAAIQREVINAALVASINSGYSAYITAASLGSGNGFTLTDVGPYYGPRKQGAFPYFGSTQVELQLDDNGFGFPDTPIVATGGFGYRVLTTPAVYAVGVGANILGDVPIVDQMYGRVISGVTNGQAMFNPPPPSPTSAQPVTNQNYDLFVISWYKKADLPTIGMRIGLQECQTYIWVDNGTGTNTANLAGWNTFEHEMHKYLFSKSFYGESSVREFFDQSFIEQGALGAVPVVTTTVNGASLNDTATNLVNFFQTSYGTLGQSNLQSVTLVTPAQGLTGLLLEQTTTATHGNEYTPVLSTINAQEFVVGSSKMMVVAKVKATTIANANFYVGFRTKGGYITTAHTVTNDYAQVAMVGVGSYAVPGTNIATGGSITVNSTYFIVSSKPIVTTVVSEFIVRIDMNGVATAVVDGVSYPIQSSAGVPLVIPVGTILVPFLKYISNGTAATLTASELVAVNDDTVIA